MTQHSAVGFATEVRVILLPASDPEGVFVQAIQDSHNTCLSGFTNIYDVLGGCVLLLEQADDQLLRVLIVVTDD